MLAAPVTRRSLEQLENELIALSSRINAAEYEFLVLVREFELRQGWREWHFNNCAEWLNMKCGISLGAAREKVRVALALFDLPACSEAFENGRLSYSKARAITRAANRSNEHEFLEYALEQTASRVEDYCRVRRNADRKASTPDANRAHRARFLSRSIHPDGGMTITVELPQEMGELVMKAIELGMVSGGGTSEGVESASPVTEEAKPEAESYFALQADALVEVARAYLAGGAASSSSTSDHYQVMVHVDESALRNEGGKSDLPIESVLRITCDTNLIAVVQDGKCNPLDVGRKHRVVSPALKRALIARDKHCRFPGCCHDKWLDAHHIIHWALGGETSLANTLLLCKKHHRLLHEGGYTIQKNFRGEWYFRHANGRVIESWGKEDASRDVCGADFMISEPKEVYSSGSLAETDSRMQIFPTYQSTTSYIRGSYAGVGCGSTSKKENTVRHLTSQEIDLASGGLAGTPIPFGGGAFIAGPNWPGGFPSAIAMIGVSWGVGQVIGRTIYSETAEHFGMSTGEALYRTIHDS